VVAEVMAITVTVAIIAATSALLERFTEVVTIA
jgi:hypothetical protein